MINRRTFFTQVALSLSFMALPKVVQAGTTTRRYQLTASKGSA